MQAPALTALHAAFKESCDPLFARKLYIYTNLIAILHQSAGDVWCKGCQLHKLGPSLREDPGNHPHYSLPQGRICSSSGNELSLPSPAKIHPMHFCCRIAIEWAYIHIGSRVSFNHGNSDGKAHTLSSTCYRIYSKVEQTTWWGRHNISDTWDTQ